ncbi:MAG: hypothetical protein KDD27_03095, partial [Saprospiraceae bacterium]|nr:hypothetical protein [Saprospiraceae bacterium]
MTTLFTLSARAWQLTLLFIALLSITATAQHKDYFSKEKEAKKAEKFKHEEAYEKEFEHEEEEEDFEEEMAASLERYLQEFNMTKDPALNVVPRERLIAARKFAETKWQQLLAETAIPGINWTERGPNNVGGRTRAILVDASDGTGNTVWAAGVAGGLWKTTNFSNATPTWTKANDFFDNLAVCSIVQDPANSSIIYFGTGEGYSNVDAVRGLGIWKTTNGGGAWTQLASTNNASFYYVQDLLIDNSGNLYAATHSGVRRSTDGGTSWAQVLGSSVGAGATNSASDLELGADGDVYATLGIFSPGSIFKSDAATYGANTGALGNWANITPTAGTYQRIEIATAPNDANRIYAVCQGGATYSADYLFRSSNGGTSWTSLTVPGFCDNGTADPDFTRGQAWYDFIMAVDPNDAQTVYVGGVDALRSTDGGNTWSQITSWTGANCTGQAYVHADHHVIKFINGSSTNAIWGTDGGISHTTNATATLPTFTTKNGGYNVTQFYACAVHPNSGSNYFLAGAQDNGTRKFTMAGLGSTTSFSGGDGAFCHIDQDNPNIQISAFTRNNYAVSLNGGTSIAAYPGFNNNGMFINPTDYDNTQNKLYASDVQGSYLRWDDPSTGGSTFVVINAGFAGQVSAVTVDPVTANRVWMGDDAGNVYRVDNAHTGTPTVTTFTPPGGAYVSSIDVDPTNQNRLMVCRSNYGVNSIYQLSIAGNTGTWTSFEGNLPDMPVRWGIFNPNNPDQALIATELGVWSTDNINGGTTDWDPTNIGLANVRVDMLQYRVADNLIAAATHGRGLYTATLQLGLFPSCSSLTTPANGAVGVPVTSALTWSAATNNPTGYRLDVGTTSGGTDILNNFDVGNVTTYNPPGDFPMGTFIYVTIKPYNANGNAVGCSEESFFTEGGAPCIAFAYCAASATTGCGAGDEFISNVTFNTINNTSTCAQNGAGNYTNYTGISTTVNTGTSYTLNVTNGNPFGGDQCKAWFDWNANGVFTDAGEEFTLTGSGTNNAQNWTVSVPVPGGATLASTRMRVRLTFTTGMAPCGVSSFGETEDYCITINSAGCTPPVVTAPTVTQPTCAVPTGTIVVNATGGGTLEYSVNNGTNWQASNTFSSLAAGSYTIKVRLQANPTCMASYGMNPVVLNAPTG